MGRPPDVALRRLRQVLEQEPALAGASVSDGVFVDSDSNDVWRLGARYLRVCWRGDRGRLVREAKVVAALPSTVPHAPVVAVSSDGDLAWMVTAEVPGLNLGLHWPSMSPIDRRHATEACALALRSLHEWRPPTGVIEALEVRVPVDRDDPHSVVGADVNPLPMARVDVLLEAAARMPHVDRGVVDAVSRRMQSLAAADPFASDERRVVVHGDLSVSNVLWGSGGIAALLDFEWARLGPADLDLLALADEPLVPGAARSPMAEWIFACYPELFAHPALEDRLWLYELASTLRGLIAWPPRSAADSERPDGGLARLRRLAGAPPPIVVSLVQATTGERGSADRGA